jgi:hypothetical protein
MKCWYCKTYLGEPHYHGQPAPVLLHCTDCPTEVEYRFGSQAKVDQVIFSSTYHGQTYLVCIEPERELKFSIYKVEGNLWFPAVRVKTIPNVNPSNIRNKIATYLVFS